MLLKNELKKLYIKQYGLIVLLIVFIAKLLTSADLYKASYSDMLYEQQKYYLEYMQEYGGQLTYGYDGGVFTASISFLGGVKGKAK